MRTRAGRAVSVGLWKPNWGGVWLVVGGLIAGFLAFRYFNGDIEILLLGIVSLPMVIAGYGLFHASKIGVAAD